MPIAINGSGTITGVSVGGLPDGVVTSADLNFKPGKVIQRVISSAETHFSSTSETMVETPVTGAITPLLTSSKILVTAICGVWPAAGSYLHIQLRSSGGNTNNNIGTWADAYGNSVSGSSSACYNSTYTWEHTSHSASSEITYKIFGRKQSSTGGSWYFPNNNGDTNRTIAWMLIMEEQA